MKARDLVFGDMAKKRSKVREGIIKKGLRPNPDSGINNDDDVQVDFAKTQSERDGKRKFPTGTRTESTRFALLLGPGFPPLAFGFSDFASPSCVLISVLSARLFQVGPAIFEDAAKQAGLGSWASAP